MWAMRACKIIIIISKYSHTFYILPTPSAPNPFAHSRTSMPTKKSMKRNSSRKHVEKAKNSRMEDTATADAASSCDQDKL